MHVYDGLGNPLDLLTDSSTTGFSSTYDPYGLQAITAGSTDATGTQNPYAFHSGIQDRASGLVKFGIRWYNPVTGTWTQEDTLDAPLDPANANRYVFVGGDPISGSDPTGQCTLLDELSYIGGFSLIGGLALGAVGGGVGLAAGLATSGPTAGVSIPVGVAAGYGIGTAVGNTAGALVGVAVAHSQC